MALHARQETPRGEEPVQEQIVVKPPDATSSVILEASLEESTGDSSQQQSTGNSNDRQPSLHEPNASNGEQSTHSSTVHDAPSNQDAPNSQCLAPKPSILKKDEQVQASENSTAITVASKRCHQCQDLDEDQWHPQMCDGCVRASSNGRAISPSPCEKKGPSKKARSGLWCKDCLTLKGLPGEGNRTRRNARHGCQDCATLREEAGLPRGKRKSAASSTPKGQGPSQARRSQSEPGNSRSTPKKAGPSQRATHKTFAAIWQRQNGKTAQPASNKPGKLAVASKQQHERKRGFDPSTESDDPDNPPEPIKNSTLVDVFKDHSESIRRIQENFRRWKAQPPAAAGRSSDFFDEDGTPFLANNNANGPQQQRSGQESDAFARSPPVPSPSPGAPSGPNEPQRNASSLRDFMYPDPMEFSRPSTRFEDAMSDIQRSRTFEASPAPFDFSGLPESATPAPADPPAPQRHPDVQDSLIDPRLLEVPLQPAASTAPANGSPATTNNNQNNGEQDGEEEDMFD